GNALGSSRLSIPWLRQWFNDGAKIGKMFGHIFGIPLSLFLLVGFTSVKALDIVTRDNLRTDIDPAARQRLFVTEVAGESKDRQVALQVRMLADGDLHGAGLD